jgi:hypothetical protein
MRIYFYDCADCVTLLRPKVGDCCVFCSYQAREIKLGELQKKNPTCFAQPLEPSPLVALRSSQNTMQWWMV